MKIRISQNRYWQVKLHEKTEIGIYNILEYIINYICWYLLLIKAAEEVPTLLQV